MEIKIGSKALTKSELVDKMLEGYFRIEEKEANGEACYLYMKGIIGNMRCLLHSDITRSFEAEESYFVHYDCYNRLAEERGRIFSLSA